MKWRRRSSVPERRVPWWPDVEPEATLDEVVPAAAPESAPVEPALQETAPPAARESAPEEPALQDPAPAGADRRAHQRVELGVPGEALVRPGGSTEARRAVPVVVVDLSEGGVKLWSETAFTAGDSIHLTFEVPTSAEVIEVDLSVRGTAPAENGGHLAHCRFVDISLKALWRIVAACLALTGDDATADRIARLEGPLSAADEPVLLPGDLLAPAYDEPPADGRSKRARSHEALATWGGDTATETHHLLEPAEPLEAPADVAATPVVAPNEAEPAHLDPPVPTLDQPVERDPFAAELREVSEMPESFATQDGQPLFEDAARAEAAPVSDEPAEDRHRRLWPVSGAADVEQPAGGPSGKRAPAASEDLERGMLAQCIHCGDAALQLQELAQGDDRVESSWLCATCGETTYTSQSARPAGDRRPATSRNDVLSVLRAVSDRESAMLAKEARLRQQLSTLETELADVRLLQRLLQRFTAGNRDALPVPESVLASLAGDDTRSD